MQIGDRMPQFSVLNQGSEVITPVSHQRFIDNYELSFPLLSDPAAELIQALGVYGEKKMYEKTVMGTLRKTFVFNQDGTQERVIEKVYTKNHTEQIL